MDRIDPSLHRVTSGCINFNSKVRFVIIAAVIWSREVRHSFVLGSQHFAVFRARNPQVMQQTKRTLAIRSSNRVIADFLSKAGDRWLPVLTGLVPVFIWMAIYNEIGIVISRTRPMVIGTVVEVSRDQGKYHVTNASIEFPSGDGYQATCLVRTWFRHTDKDINVGAPITVVPAITHCATPWFPDHIPPFKEGLGLASGCAVLVYSILLYRRKRAFSRSQSMMD